MNYFAQAQPTDLQKSCSRVRTRRKNDDFLANLLIAREEGPNSALSPGVRFEPFQVCLNVAVLLKAAMSMLVGMRIEWTEHSAPWLEAIKDRLHDDVPVANDKSVGAVFNSVGRGICGPLYVGVVAGDIFNSVFESAVR